ncbi:MAG: N-acetyltransferase family protein [Patescibacteria group bacterium]
MERSFRCSPGIHPRVERRVFHTASRISHKEASLLPDFAIRSASGGDLAAINDIYNDAVLHTTATFDLEPRGMEEASAWFRAHGAAYPLFVAACGGRVIGWSSLSPYAPRPAYRYTVEDSVYVHRDYRGRGAGRALLAAVVQAAAALGYRAIVAKVADHNGPSLAVHKALGFAEIGTLIAVGYKFDRWLDVDLLELLLPAGRAGGMA